MRMILIHTIKYTNDHTLNILIGCTGIYYINIYIIYLYLFKTNRDIILYTNILNGATL